MRRCTFDSVSNLPLSLALLILCDARIHYAIQILLDFISRLTVAGLMNGAVVSSGAVEALRNILSEIHAIDAAFQVCEVSWVFLFDTLIPGVLSDVVIAGPVAEVAECVFLRSTAITSSASTPEAW